MESVFTIVTNKSSRENTESIDLPSACSGTYSKVSSGQFPLAAVEIAIHVYDSSLNWSLRSQAHFELAKIEEDIEQLDSAKNNLLKVRATLIVLYLTVYHSRLENWMICPFIPHALIWL